jgi:predicted DNA-binding protein
MWSRRITVRVPEALVKRLKTHADSKGRPESVLVREALENYLNALPAPDSAYDLAREAGLIGCVRGEFADLSTNRKHLKGFGEGR